MRRGEEWAQVSLWARLGSFVRSPGSAVWKVGVFEMFDNRLVGWVEFVCWRPLLLVATILLGHAIWSGERRECGEEGESQRSWRTGEAGRQAKAEAAIEGAPKKMGKNENGSRV
jgi:hypothetical protein